MTSVFGTMIFFGRMVVLVIVLFPVFLLALPRLPSVDTSECDVVIAGGSLAGFTAAISAASRGVHACLLAPTDWVGGQLTTSGVPAIDFAWHHLVDPRTNRTYPVYKFARAKENISPTLNRLLKLVNSSGDCWVSQYCFLPKSVIAHGLDVLMEDVRDFLHVFYNTVVRRVRMDPKTPRRIAALQAVTRSEPTSHSGSSSSSSSSCPLLHQEWQGWYSLTPDKWFRKKLLRDFVSRSSVYIDATESGTVMALSAPDSYLQGLSERYDGDVSRIGNEECGQSIVFGFCERLAVHEESWRDPWPVPHPEYYSLQKYTYERVWTYRRLLDAGKKKKMNLGDITLQNWGRGNDYPFAYLFKSFEAAKEERERDVWSGGVRISTLEQAEYHAFGFHSYYKNLTKKLMPEGHVALDRGEMGTCHGLAKLPYLRDTRRSIGVDDFVMKVSDISGDFTRMPTGTRFPDRIALGAYDVDIHKLKSCTYPSYVDRYYPVLPFYIPLRAMSNRDVTNLLVTGKLVAQSFLTSAASRTHPTEWSTGCAAGGVAAFMVEHGLDDVHALTKSRLIPEVRKYVSTLTPVEWTLRV